MTFLTAADITVTYPQNTGTLLTAVDNTTISINAGEFVSIIGPSGCGKSTLLHAMGGLYKPSVGTVTFDSKPLLKPNPRNVCFVFQEYSLLPWKTVWENAAIGLRFAKIPKGKRREKAEAVLDMVGLSEFLESYPDQLSGGMQQRVAIARALALDPAVLLMDEPFGALDEQTRRSLGFDMATTLSEQRKAVVMVTHSLDEAIYWGDRILVMSKRPGRIVRELEITAPRPRNHGFLATPEFTDIRTELLRLLDQRNLHDDVDDEYIARDRDLDSSRP